MATAGLILATADILTLDRDDARAQALAARDETLIAVGQEADVRALAGPKTELIDAHCHLLSLRGQQLLQANCSPARARSIADVIRILKAEAARTPKGPWDFGGGYDHTKLAENRHPTRHALDRVSAEHPVHLRNNSCHMRVLNSLALERAGITRRTPDPQGGLFERNADGGLTGICREEVHFLLPGLRRLGLRRGRGPGLRRLVRGPQGFPGAEPQLHPPVPGPAALEPKRRGRLRSRRYSE